MHEDGVWIAENDDLGLVTESDSFENLTDRVWEIAPDLAEANGINLKDGEMRLRFQHIESSTDHKIAL